MTIASEITRIQNAKASIKTEIENKGVTVPSNALLDAYPSYIASISGGGGGGTYQAKSVTYTPSPSATTDTVTADEGYDALSQVSVTVNAVPSASFFQSVETEFYTDNNVRKWRVRPFVELDTGEGDTEGWIGNGLYQGDWGTYNVVPSGTTITPSTSSQTIGGAKYMMESAIIVESIPTASLGTNAITHSRTSTTFVVQISYPNATEGWLTQVGINSLNNMGKSSLTLEEKTITPSESVQTVVPSNSYYYLSQVTVNSIPSSYVKPSATKGATTYQASTSDQTIAAGTYLTGTQTIKAYAVQSSTITANGTYTPSAGFNGFYTVTVSVPSGSSKNAQVVQGTTRTSSSTLTAIGAEMTVSKSGTYDVYWSAVRSSTSASYQFGSRLYVGGTAYGTENTTWNNHIQNNHLSNVSLTANQKIRVYGRNSRGSSFYLYAPTLVIVEA